MGRGGGWVGGGVGMRHFMKTSPKHRDLSLNKGRFSFHFLKYQQYKKCLDELFNVDEETEELESSRETRAKYACLGCQFRL